MDDSSRNSSRYTVVVIVAGTVALLSAGVYAVICGDAEAHIAKYRDLITNARVAVDFELVVEQLGDAKARKLFRELAATCNRFAWDGKDRICQVIVGGYGRGPDRSDMIRLVRYGESASSIWYPEAPGKVIVKKVMFLNECVMIQLSEGDENSSVTEYKIHWPAGTEPPSGIIRLGEQNRADC